MQDEIRLEHAALVRAISQVMVGLCTTNAVGQPSAGEWLLLIVSVVAVTSCPTKGRPAEVWVWPYERSGGGGGPVLGLAATPVRR
jgi:hypothetical protein